MSTTEAAIIAAMIGHAWSADDAPEGRIRKLCKAAVTNGICIDNDAQLRAVFAILLTKEEGDDKRSVQFALDGLKAVNALIGGGPGVTVDFESLQEIYEGVDPAPVGKIFREELEASKL